MSTAQITASPRAPRGKPQPQSPAQVSQHTTGRQSQRKPRGNRANNGYSQQNGAGASPSKQSLGADHPAFAEGAIFLGEQAQAHMGPRNIKKNNHSQPSIDRVFSPNGARSSFTDSEAANNPSATPAKIQGAYAGPTFHASPAPSALPIPKFLSRSVPAKTRAGPPTPPPEDSSDSANSPSPIASPSRAPIPVPTRNEDSPLDMLFKADKAERAKNTHGSPASNGFFKPSYPARPLHYQHDSYHSANGVFAIELDGEAKNKPFSPPPAASQAGHRSVTDPTKVPQLRDSPQQNGGNDVMQDLLNRLSMSQKNLPAATPPKPERQSPSGSQSRHQSPSPFHDGQPTVRSTSGPTTPQAAPQEAAEYFYGNRNLSPMFKAAKNDSSKRNSGLRTEITADSPLVGQGMFQDIPSMPPHQVMDPNAFARDQPGSSNTGHPSPHRGSVPLVSPYQQSPNNRRKTPGRQQYNARPDSQPARGNFYGQGPRGGKAAGHAAPLVSAPKSSTTMMSFVPASVSAKQHSSSAPSSSGGLSTAKAPTSSDTLALEQDLKRLLNLKMTSDTSSVR